MRGTVGRRDRVAARRYCDGTSWTSDRADAVDAELQQRVFFRGAALLNATIAALRAWGVPRAERLVTDGGFARHSDSEWPTGDLSLDGVRSSCLRRESARPASDSSTEGAASDGTSFAPRTSSLRASRQRNARG